MAKSTSLNLGDESQEDATITEEESQLPAESAPAASSPIHSGVDALQERFDALEARLASVEGKAHTEHQLSLGPAELVAIGKALEQHIKQNIVDVLRSHLGFAPPAGRGDGS